MINTKTRFVVLCCLAALTPTLVSAQVVISEIMYDAPGLEGSGEHDWVEVFNAGAGATDISAYRFFEAGTNHTLKLESGSATLQSGGYAVIASATSTFLADWPTFSGTLFDSSFNLNSAGELIGIRVDTTDTTHDFTYSPADAATNNGSSLHRASAASATFSAGAPSPGTGSLTPSGSSSGSSDSNSGAATASSQSASSQTSSASAPVSSYVAPPDPQIFADGGDNRTVIVGADTEFFGRAYNRKKETISERIRFLWNFGDGTTAEGQSVLHHFEYPGKYAVVLNIADNRDAGSARIIVTAEPAKLAFTIFPDGSVMIGNNAGRDLNLSSWIVRSFGRYFMLPKDSIILAGESLRLGEKTLGFRSSPETELDYPNGALALRAGNTNENSVSVISNIPVVAPAIASPRVAQAFAIAPAQTAQATDIQDLPPLAGEVAADAETVPSESAQTASVAAFAEAGSGGMGGYMWWLGAIGLAVAGGGAVLASRRAGKKEWDIVEESAD